MHRALEEKPLNGDWQSLRQQVAVLLNEVENLSQEVEAGGLDVTRLHNAGQLSHLISLALLALQQQEMERIRQERDVLKKDYLERARRELRFQDLDLPQLQALSAGPVKLLD
jgi:hypothetical protein